MANRPTTTKELLAFEDTFHQFTAEIRRMREKMDSLGIESVDMQTGTLEYHLIKISANMDRLTATFDHKTTPNKVRAKLSALKKSAKNGKSD